MDRVRHFVAQHAVTVEADLGWRPLHPVVIELGSIGGDCDVALADGLGNGGYRVVVRRSMNVLMHLRQVRTS